MRKRKERSQIEKYEKRDRAGNPESADFSEDLENIFETRFLLFPATFLRPNHDLRAPRLGTKVEPEFATFLPVESQF